MGLALTGMVLLLCSCSLIVFGEADVEEGVSVGVHELDSSQLELGSSKAMRAFFDSFRLKNPDP